MLHRPATHIRDPLDPVTRCLPRQNKTPHVIGDLRPTSAPRGIQLKRIYSGDLISYQNSGKGCTAIVDKVERIVSEYTGQRIYMRANEVLISADPDVRVPTAKSTPIQITQFGTTQGGRPGD